MGNNTKTSLARILELEALALAEVGPLANLVPLLVLRAEPAHVDYTMIDVVVQGLGEGRLLPYVGAIRILVEEVEVLAYLIVGVLLHHADDRELVLAILGFDLRILGNSGT